MNIDLASIHQEFIEISALLGSYDYKINETLNLIQFELAIPLDNTDLLIKLCDFNFFETLITNSPKNLNFYFDSTRKLKESEIDFLTNESLRITFEKDILLENPLFEEVDAFFFLPNFALTFILNSKKTIQSNKLHIGLYNIDCYNTHLINFSKISSLSDELVVNNLIDNEFQNKLNNISQLSADKFTNFNNIYSFMPVNSSSIQSDDFSNELINNFYLNFLKLFSHKFDTNNSSFNIRGKKSIIVRFNENVDVNEYQYFKSIIDFLLTGDKYLEKFIIIKDVLTRYLDNESDFSSLNSKIEDIEKTIKHYYNKYVTDDIDEFFLNRDAIYKEAIAMSKLINEQNDKIIAYINSTLISILVLGITFALNNFSKLDDNKLLTATFILILFSFLFFKIIKNNSVERSESIETQFDLFIKRVGIIQTEEQSEIKEKFIKTPKSDLKKALSKIKFLLIIVNFILVFLVLFNFLEPIVIHIPTTK